MDHLQSSQNDQEHPPILDACQDTNKQKRKGQRFITAEGKVHLPWKARLRCELHMRALDIAFLDTMYSERLLETDLQAATASTRTNTSASVTMSCTKELVSHMLHLMNPFRMKPAALKTITSD